MSAVRRVLHPARRGRSSPGRSGGLSIPLLLCLTFLLGVSARAEDVPSLQLELLDPGAEPRAALRYDVEAGQEERLLMTMGISMEMTMDGARMPAQTIPESWMVMTVRVTEAAGGVIRYTFTLDEAGVDSTSATEPAIGEAVQGMLDLMVGFSGTASVTRRGEALDIAYRQLESLPPGMEGLLTQLERNAQALVVPLPEEPVGSGARWRVHQVLDFDGISMTQESIYRIEVHEDETVRLSVSMLQRAGEQEPAVDPSLGGALVQIRKMTGTGKGQLGLDLRDIVPRHSFLDAENTMDMGMTVAGGQERDLKLVTRMRMGMEHAP